MPKTMLSMREVTKLAGFSRSTINSKIRRGNFPKPVKFGYSIRFVESEVNDWIDSHIEASRSEDAAA